MQKLMIQSWRQVRNVLDYLPAGARGYINRFVIVSCLLSLLDIAALMLLAVSLAAMMQGTDVQIPVIGWTIGPEHYVWLLLAVSSLILLKSLLTLGQQWAATRRMAQFELTLGVSLFDAYIGAPWVDRLSRTTSQLVRMADVGVSAVISGLIRPFMQLPALIVSATLIIVTLFIVQPMTAVICIVYLGGIAFVMSRVLTRRAVEAGRVNRDYSFKVASLMTDMVGALKEITLRNKFDEVAAIVRENRTHASRARANIQFLATVPKFILDTALIGGFLIVGMAAFLLEGSLSAAISAVVLFAVAGMRLVPALTSFQSLNNQVNANRSQVDMILGDMRRAERFKADTEEIGKVPLNGEPEIVTLADVTFCYPNREQPALNSVSMTIKMGTSVGLVGESGSGKSTLVDLLLGLLVPQEGQVLIGDQPLTDVMAAWRSRVGYVPQDVSLFDGTVEQNVALNWKGDLDREKVIDCLKRAHVWDAIEARPGGLKARVGERGMAFSGGQRQRLGIARALYTDPYVLILDEATSALDTKTEWEVAQAIADLRGDVTLISIAHRLSTVKDADELFFMENGFVLARGTFEEVVNTIPTFREQARLAGLIAGDEP